MIVKSRALINKEHEYFKKLLLPAYIHLEDERHKSLGSGGVNKNGVISDISIHRTGTVYQATVVHTKDTEIFITLEIGSLFGDLRIDDTHVEKGSVVRLKGQVA